MNQPKRIQLSRKKGWKKPEGAIVVSRPSKWGNPYHVLDYEHLPSGERQRYAVGDFRNALLNGGLGLTVEEVRRELRGKDLACWCRLDAKCHADVLLEIANKQSVFQGMSPRAVRTFRTISLACSREPFSDVVGFRGVHVTGLKGAHSQAVDLLLRMQLLRKETRKRYRTSALGDHEERLFLETRFEEEDLFQCSRCGRMTPASCGGCGDDGVDPNGDYCDECWCQEKHNIERFPVK